MAKMVNKPDAVQTFPKVFQYGTKVFVRHNARGVLSVHVEFEAGRYHYEGIVSVFNLYLNVNKRTVRIGSRSLSGRVQNVRDALASVLDILLDLYSRSDSFQKPLARQVQFLMDDVDEMLVALQEI